MSKTKQTIYTIEECTDNRTFWRVLDSDGDWHGDFATREMACTIAWAATLPPRNAPMNYRDLLLRVREAVEEALFEIDYRASYPLRPLCEGYKRPWRHSQED